MNRRFVSPFGAEMERFLVYKRSLGHPYQRGEHTLRSFDRYVHAQRAGATALPELVYGWLARIPERKAVTVATDLGVIRQFCLYRRRADRRGFVPDRQWAPQSTQSEFLPYVFSRRQVLRLLELTSTVRDASSRGLALRSLLQLLYCTGLRLGEALRLRTDDVDLDERLLWIRESKGRTRVVPFRADLAQELRRYRRALGRPAPAPFFVRSDGSAWPVKAASNAIRLLLRRAGFKPATGRRGPRPYDMRHTFAVHRLTRWYTTGVNIHARLPLLSAYMGHIDLLGTEHYLTATPELLAIAARRFRTRVAQGNPKR